MHLLLCFIPLVFTDSFLNLELILGMIFLFASIQQFQDYLFIWLTGHLDVLSKIIQAMWNGSILEPKKIYNYINMINKSGWKEEFCHQNINNNQHSRIQRMKMSILQNVNYVEHKRQMEFITAVLAKDVFTKWIIIVHGQVTVWAISPLNHFFFFFFMLLVSVHSLLSSFIDKHIY